MRVRLKGIDTSVKRLADGTVRRYHYAWRGGPQLRGEPGSADFIASYNEAVASRLVPKPGTVASILVDYQSSDDFKGLAERTRADYLKILKRVAADFGTLPLAALPDPRTRGLFLGWRDRLPGKSRKWSDYHVVVLARLFSWSLDRGLIEKNPLQKPGRRYRGSRRDKVWTHEDETNFLAKAPTHMHLPFLLAIWTAQRQGDLLRLPWSSYDGRFIRLRQGKTSAKVEIPVGEPLRVALDAAEKAKKSPLVLVNSEGKPWTADGFRSSWRKACAKAGVAGLTFHDLRGSCITRLAAAGASEAGIAIFSGLSLNDVRNILDRHYLNRDSALAEATILKLEQRTKLRTDPQTGPN